MNVIKHEVLGIICILGDLGNGLWCVGLGLNGLGILFFWVYVFFSRGSFFSGAPQESTSVG